jgi:hypothetical protein
MSAVPKKKLCWNCEGNVAKNIDNCPYCGVYLHAAEMEDESAWNPSYRPDLDNEDIPSPLYQIKPQVDEESEEEAQTAGDSKSMTWNHLFSQLKYDVFPILFLMMGSVFFLFGIVLLLFSQNGTFTLQWKESDGLYFLLFAVPLIGFGWMYFQRLEANE